MFTTKDQQQIEAKGISLATVEKQLAYFKRGFPYLSVVKPATIGDGIRSLNTEEVQQAVTSFNEGIKKRRILKFVPASGAATRMFKELFDFLNTCEQQGKVPEAAIHDKKNYINIFISNLERFAFYPDLHKVLASEGKDIKAMVVSHDYAGIIRCLLNEGMHYSSLPKGLLLFHRYGDQSRTAAEEHLVEGAMHARNNDDSVYIHFTVSAEHMEKFSQHIEEKKNLYEKRFGVVYHISYSTQDPSTDIIAVDMHNNPFREADGRLLFRPGGHGALLSNLNALDADCIMIKNIDNITVDRYKDVTYLYKKVLAGILFSTEEKIHGYIKKLNTNRISEAEIKKIENFVKTELCCLPPMAYNNYDIRQKSAYLLTKLNRPLRCCGMVKSEGDTGGGPFWAMSSDGSQTLQIAETPQLDTKNPEVQKIIDASTHFNPADFALSIKNFRGEKFSLFDFRDPDTGFITKKSKEGKDLKAQELPGLWNGSMSEWNTIFIEVPLITFNPVKSINDLLKETHT